MANGLKKFVDDLKGDPPRTVSAPKLDENFARCMPAQRGLLADLQLNFTHEGWYLESDGLLFDVCENGTPVKYRLLGKRQ
jgi:hypothetical protein